MADVLFGPALTEESGGDKVFEIVKKQYPGIAQVLQGRTKEMKGGVFPPSTIMLSMDMGVLKFCCSPKYGAHVCFGTLDDPTDILGCLDKAIRAGKVDWRPRSNKK